MSATFSRSRSILGRTEKIYYALSLFMLFLAVFVYAYPSMYMLHKGYVHQIVTVEVKRELARQNRLKLEYEILMAAADIESRAIVAGFIDPSSEQVVFVEKRR